MYTINKLEYIYNKSKNDLRNLFKNNTLNEKNLEAIILDLSLNNKLEISTKNIYNLASIKKLLNFYEKMMKNSFPKDKMLFQIQFNLYIHIIKIFSLLCKRLNLDKNKRIQVQKILQILKESKNMLKLSIPLNKEIINILNNTIGQDLYRFTHFNYFDINKRDIDYILEYYIYSCEKIVDGYELSLSTSFGNSLEVDKSIELLKFKNNLTFFLLSMFYKLNFHFPDIDLTENYNYQKIYHYISKLPYFNTKIDTKKFKEFLFEEFNDSSKKLIHNNKKYYYDEKISILTLNTDEYKELIDIISKLK